jgi:hypothetical protein
MTNRIIGFYVLFALIFSLTLTGCFEDESDSSEKEDVFELTGKWAANDVEIKTSDYSITADLVTTFTETTFEGTTTVTSSDPDQITTNSGEITSFNNSENWYVGKILDESTDSDTIGKYGMTRYTLSEDGESFVGTSYSYEDSEEEAKASTTIVSENITMIKQ